jgi:hypothetical protein
MIGRDRCGWSAASIWFDILDLGIIVTIAGAILIIIGIRNSNRR